MTANKKERIGHFHEANNYQKDNEYIHSGYRLHFSSKKKILRSLFMLHNESVNVWSHLLGVVVFLVFLCYCLAWLGVPQALNLHTPEVISSTLDRFSGSYNSLGNSSEGLWNTAVNYEHILEEKLSDMVVQAQVYEKNIEKLVVEVYKEAWKYGLGIEEALLRNYGNLGNQTSGKWEYLKALVESKLQGKLDWLDIYNPYINENLPKQNVEVWPVLVFLVSAMFCMGCSSMFHLFCDHSHDTFKVFARLDYGGIAILICGSFFPAIYYPFYCKNEYIILYLGGISVSSLVVFCVSLSSFFQRPEFRWFRGTIFLVLGLLGSIPCLHFSMLPDIGNFSSSMFYYLMMAFTYIFGVFIYILRFPERFYPGKFDYFGNSHNLWHMFVLLAAIWHYLGALDSYHLREIMPCPAN